MISAIILAGGSSRRMGPGVDKLMILAADVPLLTYPLLAFEHCKEITEIILVARDDRQTTYKTLVETNKITKLTHLVPAGAERQDSVWNGLKAVSPKSELVLIHDGARALVTEDIITRCINVARRSGAAIPASRVKDTIKQAAPHQKGHDLQIASTLDRSTLWAAQTPQTFRTDLIRKAYESVMAQKSIITDDAAAVESIGHPVSIVECDPLNLKVTTPEDMLLAELLLSNRKPKVHSL
jgi:2-C-methyl-D-erythritol 4-phosphate cytidylyltransferase